MNELLARAVEAHGGLERWNRIHAIDAKISVGGSLWELVGRPGLFADTRVVSLTRSSYIEVDSLAQHRAFLFRSGRVSVWNEAGEPLIHSEDVRATFFRPNQSAVWDDAQAAYFDGYALWQYLNAPFLYTYPGFVIEDAEPWIEGNEMWKGIRITFPDTVVAHSKVQYAYFGDDGLLRCLRYTVDILGGARGLHYVLEYAEVQGIKFPVRREVYGYDDELKRIVQPLLVSINVREPSLIVEGSCSLLY